MGSIAKDNDIDQTWEGDNDILLQQTAGFLLRNLNWLSKGKQIQETCEFLTLDTSDESIFKDISTAKVLTRLIATRACQKAHMTGMKIVSDFSKWNTL
jgi:acyl-CoA oxidase